MSTDTSARTNVGANVIAFTYAIGERVYLKDAECWGRCRQMTVNTSGREYQVAWFDEDKCRHVEWFDEYELARTAPC